MKDIANDFVIWFIPVECTLMELSHSNPHLFSKMRHKHKPTKHA